MTDAPATLIFVRGLPQSVNEQEGDALGEFLRGFRSLHEQHVGEIALHEEESTDPTAMRSVRLAGRRTVRAVEFDYLPHFRRAMRRRGGLISALVLLRHVGALYWSVIFVPILSMRSRALDSGTAERQRTWRGRRFVLFFGVMVLVALLVVTPAVAILLELIRTDSRTLQTVTVVVGLLGLLAFLGRAQYRYIETCLAPATLLLTRRFRFDAIAREFESLLIQAKRRGGPVVVVTHSFGGALLVRLLSNVKSRPDEVISVACPNSFLDAIGLTRDPTLREELSALADEIPWTNIYHDVDWMAAPLNVAGIVDVHSQAPIANVVGRPLEAHNDYWWRWPGEMERVARAVGLTAVEAVAHDAETVEE